MSMFLLLCALADAWAAEESPAAAGDPTPLPAPPAAPAPADPAPVGAVAPAAGPGLVAVPFGWDLIPGVGTSATHRGQDLRSLSVGLVTWAGGVDGVSADLAGLVGGDVAGVQGSAMAAVAHGRVDGVQVSGGLAWAGAGVDGVQGAAAVAAARGVVDGVQGAGGAALALGGGQGVQGAGGAAVAGGRFEGLQAAPVTVAQQIDGAQVGVLNIASENAQGVQLGLINVARESDAPIGLINFIWKGRTHLQVAGTEAGFVLGTVAHGGRYVHHQYGVAWRPTENCPEWALVWGMGAHAPLGGRWFVDPELLAMHVSPVGRFRLGAAALGTVRANVGVAVVPRLAFTVGPAYSVWVSDQHDGSAYAPGIDQVYRAERDLAVRGWPGVHVGLRLF